MPARRVVLATFGSLGDLHPYIALAKQLARRGHEPVIATTDHYEPAIRAAGLGFAPMHPLEAQLGPPERHIEKLFDRWRGPEYMVRELLMPYVRQSYDDLLAAARDADAL